MRDAHQTATNSLAGTAARILASYPARALARRTGGIAVGTPVKALLLALLTAMSYRLAEEATIADTATIGMWGKGVRV